MDLEGDTTDSRVIYDTINASSASTFSPMNLSGGPGRAPSNPIGIAIIASLFSVISLITVLGNVAVIATTVIEKRMHHPSRILVTSLAVTDLLTGLLVMPHIILFIVAERWVLGEFLCYTSLAVTIIVTQSSIWHLVMIALDRLLAVVWESYVVQKMRRRRIVAGMIWFSWVGATALPVIMCFTAGFPIVTPFFCVAPQTALFHGVTWVNGMVLPMTLIVVLYVAVFIRVRRVSGLFQRPGSLVMAGVQGTEPVSGFGATELTVISQSYDGSTATCMTDSSDGNSYDLGSEAGTKVSGEIDFNEKLPGKKRETQRFSKSGPTCEALSRVRERKLLRILLILTLSFTICWLPYALVLFAKFFTVVPGAALFGGIWILLCNSMVNPIVYTIFCQEYRMACKRVCNKLKNKITMTC